MRSATTCATPPASGRTSSRNVPTCCCTCMSRVRPRSCPWISPARACTGAAIAAKEGARRSRRTLPRPCCCAPVGPAFSIGGGTLLDPMCGSGTFLTEAALIAADAAPALDREYFGFTGWRGHDAALWEQLREEARERRSARAARQTRCILGSDVDADAVRMAIANGEQAGVADWLHVEKRSLAEIVRPKGDAGLDRRESAVRRTHRRGVGPARPVFGTRQRVARPIPGMAGRDSHRQSAARQKPRDLCQAHPSVLQRHHRVPAAALRSERGQRATAGRGGARRLVEPARRADVRESIAQEPAASRPLGRARTHRMFPRCTTPTCPNMPSPSIFTAAARDTSMFKNTLRPEPSIRRERGNAAARRWRYCRKSWPCRRRQVHSRVRKPQKGSEQYEKRDTRAERHAVFEGGLKFWVNFRDYLDTGLFLDHRIVRATACATGRRARIS